MTKTFLTTAIVAATLVVAHPVIAQTAGQLVQMRTACGVGQGNCLAFIQAFVAQPGFVGLTAAQQTQVVGVLAAELREIGVATPNEIVDIDVESALRELAQTTPDTAQGTQITALVEDIRQDDAGEIPVGTFSDN